MKEINCALVLVYVCGCMHIRISVSSVGFESVLVLVCVRLIVFVHSKTCGEFAFLLKSQLHQRSMAAAAASPGKGMRTI